MLAAARNCERRSSADWHAQAATAGLTGWRRSTTGKFSVPAAAAPAQPGQAQRITIEQEDTSTNAYLYQRTPVACPSCVAFVDIRITQCR